MPKGEEIRFLGHVVRRQCSPRHFNHCTDQIFHALAFLGKDGFCRFLNDLFLIYEFFNTSDERHHDFREHVYALLVQFYCGLNDGPCLHCSDFRVCYTESASAVSEHRIVFGKFGHLGIHYLGG